MQHAHWIHLAREHWRENQPQRYARLKREGKLESALARAAKATSREISNLVASGFDRDQAWEMVREQHLFPPAEEGAWEETPPSEAYSIARQAMSAIREAKQNDPD